MKLTDEAVEAAARAWQDMRAQLGYPEWDNLDAMGQEWRLDHMRAALEAAGPHLLAEGWDGGYLQGRSDSGWVSRMTPNPYRPAA